MSAALDLQNEESLQLKIIKTFMHGMMLFGKCLKQCKALKAHSDWQLKLPIYPLLFTSEKLAPKYIVIIVEINKLKSSFCDILCNCFSVQLFAERLLQKRKKCRQQF